MKVGDKLICKKSLSKQYSGAVGELYYGITPNCKYEIVEMHHHELSVKVDFGFCIWFTRSKEPWKEFEKLDEYFYTVKEIRKIKLNKLNNEII